MQSFLKREPDNPGRASVEQPTGAVSAPVVFAILIAVVVLVVAAAIFLSSDPAERPRIVGASVSPTQSPTDHSLTDDEAIERLAELDAMRIRALETRDVSLLQEAFTPDSPAAERVKKSIRTLIEDDVYLEHRRYEVQRSEVIVNRSNRVEIRQTVMMHVEFTDEKGQQLTRGSGREVQVIVTTMKPVGHQWLFFDGQILEADPL